MRTLSSVVTAIAMATSACGGGQIGDGGEPIGTATQALACPPGTQMEANAGDGIGGGTLRTCVAVTTPSCNIPATTSCPTLPGGATYTTFAGYAVVSASTSAGCPNIPTFGGVWSAIKVPNAQTGTSEIAYVPANEYVGGAQQVCSYNFVPSGSSTTLSVPTETESAALCAAAPSDGLGIVCSLPVWSPQGGVGGQTCDTCTVKLPTAKP